VSPRLSDETRALVRRANELFEVLAEANAEMYRYARNPKFSGRNVLFTTDGGYHERCVRLGRISHEWIGARDEAMAALVKEAGLQ
jgi:hypothetical protein